MPRLRQLNRRAWRAHQRTCLRTRRGCPRGLVHLTHALTAFRQALRCHRRLARLAPRFFDSVIVDREKQERAEQRRWLASWEPALRAAYGPDSASAPARADADLPPLPGPRTQRAVERELAGWKFWMAAGRLALERHHQLRPHALLSFSQMAQLLQLGHDFGRLAAGCPSTPPPPPEPHDQCLQDLQRAYGTMRSASNGHLAASEMTSLSPSLVPGLPCGRGTG